jgi:ribosomal-protein-alanine N-acetyltransferase
LPECPALVAEESRLGLAVRGPALISVIETERLVLREFTLDDVDAMFAIIGDAETMKYYPQPFSRDDAADWIQRNLERYSRDGVGLYAVILKATDDFIGDCGFAWQEVEGDTLLEVGYHLHRDHWGHGYATEAAKHCMRYAFEHLGVAKVVSFIRPENLPSRRVAERNGMTIERQIIFHGLPHLLYAMRRENYGQA